MVFTPPAKVERNTAYKYTIAFRTATKLRDYSYIKMDFTSLYLPEDDEFYCTIDLPAAVNSDGFECYAEKETSADTVKTRVYIKNLAEVAKETTITVVLNLISGGDSANV